MSAYDNKELVLNTCRNASLILGEAAEATDKFIDVYECYPEFPTKENEKQMQENFLSMMKAHAQVEMLMRKNGLQDELLNEN